MPFPARVISKRVDIQEVFDGTTENILQKTSVSNLLGLLNQLNQISLHANSIFTDVLNTTHATNTRIKSIKQRINNLQPKIPSVESLLISNAPSYFYDNPYGGKEYLRNDPLNGLLFSREDATKDVNNRRNTARPHADLSALDKIQDGPCIKRFTDPDFFINEWLENEKLKREEAREQRRKDRQNRKKERSKRKQTKKIKKLKRKRWDEQGNVIADDGVAEIAVNQQYQFTDDTNRNFDALLQSKKKVGKKKKKIAIEHKEEKEPPRPPQKHEQVVSYNIPPQTVKKAHVNVLSTSDSAMKPPPVPPVAEMKQEPIITPPPNPMMSTASNFPPPNPLMLKMSGSMSEKSSAKLRGLSAEIPMNDISYDVPDNAPSPAQIYAKSYQKRDLENEQLDLASGSKIIAETPKQVKPIAPKFGFLGDIASFNKKGKLKRTEVNVNRHKPMDKRTNMLAQLKNNKVKLSSVNLRKIAPKKEEKKALIFEAMADRRRHMQDSSSDEESDWGSESE